MVDSELSLRYELEGRGSNLCGGKRFFFSPKKKSRPAPGPNQPSAQWVPCLFLGVKRPGWDGDHLTPSSADVKNEWRYKPTPPYAFIEWTGTALNLPLLSLYFEVQDALVSMLILVIANICGQMISYCQVSTFAVAKQK